MRADSTCYSTSWRIRKNCRAQLYLVALMNQLLPFQYNQPWSSCHPKGHSYLLNLAHFLVFLVKKLWLHFWSYQNDARRSIPFCSSAKYKAQRNYHSPQPVQQNMLQSDATLQQQEQKCVNALQYPGPLSTEMCGPKMQQHLNRKLILQVITLQVHHKNTENTHNYRNAIT